MKIEKEKAEQEKSETEFAEAERQFNLLSKEDQEKYLSQVKFGSGKFQKMTAVSLFWEDKKSKIK